MSASSPWVEEPVHFSDDYLLFSPTCQHYNTLLVLPIPLPRMKMFHVTSLNNQIVIAVTYTLMKYSWNGCLDGTYIHIWLYLYTPTV